MKLKTLPIGLIAIGGGLFGLFAYFAGAVSAVYDPLRSYNYPLSMDELKKGLAQTVRSNPDLTFNLTDSTGLGKGDPYYYADIFVKDAPVEYEFLIKYNKKSKWFDNKIKSEISLIGAFDRIHRTGGYRPEDKGIEKLINIFDERLIKELDKYISTIK
jgi:hypothetical protein